MQAKESIFSVAVPQHKFCFKVKPITTTKKEETVVETQLLMLHKVRESL